MFNSLTDGWIDRFENKESIAIVGNSPNLLNVKNGAYIDSFDIVCRFNNYKTKSYEINVGSKVDVYVTCLIDNPDVTSERLIEEGVKAVFVTRPIAKKYAYNSAIGEMLKNFKTVVPFDPVFVPEHDFDDLCNHLSIAPNNEGINPSSGLTFVYTLLKHFHFEKIFLTGFDFFNPHNKQHMHYFDGDIYDQEDKYTLIEKYHPRKNEMEFFISLVKKYSIDVDKYVKEELQCL